MAARSWKIRGFKLEDLPRISQFRKAFTNTEGSFRRSCEAEYYEWKCCRNPMQPGEIWLAEDGEKIVGTTTLTPKRMRILGKIVCGAEIGDTFTHPDYQRQGIFSTLVERTRREGLNNRISFIYGTPNEQSLPGYEKKCAFAQVPSACITNVVRPVNIRHVLEALIRPRLLASPTSLLLSAAYAILFKVGRDKRNESIHVSKVDSFPNSMEILCEQASKSHDVILVRDSIYLEWRFITNQDGYTIMIAKDEKSILGYLVTKIGSWRNLTVGYIADFMTLRDDSRTFRSLLVEALNSLQNRKVDMVSCWVTRRSFYERVLRKAGFLPYKTIPIICYKNELGNQVLGGHYNWHFTMADSDNI